VELLGKIRVEIARMRVDSVRQRAHDNLESLIAVHLFRLRNQDVVAHAYGFAIFLVDAVCTRGVALLKVKQLVLHLESPLVVRFLLAGTHMAVISCVSVPPCYVRLEYTPHSYS